MDCVPVVEASAAHAQTWRFRIMCTVTGAAMGFSLLSMVALAGETLLAVMARAGLLIRPARGAFGLLGTVHALYFTSLLMGTALGLCTCRTRGGRLALLLALLALLPAISYCTPAGHM